MTNHIELGHALITMIEPDPATVRAYNRWYEHDHFLSGVLTGPGAFAGRRFVATRTLKDLRFPDVSPVARPVDDGSFITVYWIERGQLAAHCDWGFPEAARLAKLGRMNTDRHHVSTAYYDLVGAAARDAYPVPVELALHHPYAGIVVVWTEASSGDHEAAASDLRRALTREGAPVAHVVTFRPIVLPDPLPAMPGSIIGDDPGRDLLVHCCFVDEASRSSGTSWAPAASFVRGALRDTGDLHTLLAAPFIPTVAGSDIYLDQLW